MAAVNNPVAVAPVPVPSTSAKLPKVLFPAASPNFVDAAIPMHVALAVGTPTSDAAANPAVTPDTTAPRIRPLASLSFESFTCAYPWGALRLLRLTDIDR